MKAGWAAASTALSPDWVGAGTVAAAVSVLVTIGGAIAWVKLQLDRREDRRAAELERRAVEQRRLDELHRDDRAWWADRLGVGETEAEYRATLTAVEAAHREQLAEQHAQSMKAIGDLERRLERISRATEIRGLRHRRWDEAMRRDIVALGGRDPGDPPALYETDGDRVGVWVEDPPPAVPPPDPLPRRRVEDDETEGP